MSQYWSRLLLLYSCLGSVEDVAERWRLAYAAASRWRSS